MNGTYYSNPTFPNNDTEIEDESNSRIIYNDILSNNIGKKITANFIFDNSKDNKEFTGRLEYVDNKYIIISNPSTNHYNLILVKYLNYITFEEKINT